MANINGWGRGTWGEGSWGTALPVEISAPSAATSALGTVSTIAKANVTPTGQAATGGVSGVGVNAQAVAVCPSAVGTLGSVSVLVDGEANVFPTDAEANVSPTGQSATGSVGSVLVWSLIDDSQTSNFTSINEAQTPNWEDVA